jgi:hypothetical protein
MIRLLALAAILALAGGCCTLRLAPQAGGPRPTPWPGASPADCEAQRTAPGDAMSPMECYQIIGVPMPPPPGGRL